MLAAKAPPAGLRIEPELCDPATGCADYDAHHAASFLHVEADGSTLAWLLEMVRRVYAMPGVAGALTAALGPHGWYIPAGTEPPPYVGARLSDVPWPLPERVGDDLARRFDLLAKAVEAAAQAAPSLDAAAAGFLATLVPPAVPNVFERDAAPIPTMHAVRALVGAIHDGSAARHWHDHAGQMVPVHRTLTSRGRGAVYVSVRDAAGSTTPAVDVLPQLWEQVRALDDLTSDVLLVCLAHWATRSGRPDRPVWITADAVLDARGIQRKRYRRERALWAHGHRREDRLDVARAFARLDALWLQLVNVEVIPPGRGRKPQRVNVESKALVWLDKITQPALDGGEPIFLAARVMPGAWASEYAALDVWQTGLLAQRALAYDPYREQPERRLAKYLAFHVRINSKYGRTALNLQVRTLLETAGLTPERANPVRTRERLEAALDRLQADGLLDGRRYVLDPDQLPARRWLDAWLGFTVALTPPAALREQYAPLTATARATQAPRRRRTPRVQAE